MTIGLFVGIGGGGDRHGLAATGFIELVRGLISGGMECCRTGGCGGDFDRAAAVTGISTDLACVGGGACCCCCAAGRTAIGSMVDCRVVAESPE